MSISITPGFTRKPAATGTIDLSMAGPKTQAAQRHFRENAVNCDWSLGLHKVSSRHPEQMAAEICRRPIPLIHQADKVVDSHGGSQRIIGFLKARLKGGDRHAPLVVNGVLYVPLGLFDRDQMFNGTFIDCLQASIKRRVGKAFGRRAGVNILVQPDAELPEDSVEFRAGPSIHLGNQPQQWRLHFTFDTADGTVESTDPCWLPTAWDTDNGKGRPIGMYKGQDLLFVGGRLADAPISVADWPWGGGAVVINQRTGVVFGDGIVLSPMPVRLLKDARGWRSARVERQPDPSHPYRPEALTIHLEPLETALPDMRYPGMTGRTGQDPAPRVPVTPVVAAREPSRQEPAIRKAIKSLEDEGQYGGGTIMVATPKPAEPGLTVAGLLLPLLSRGEGKPLSWSLNMAGLPGQSSQTLLGGLAGEAVPHEHRNGNWAPLSLDAPLTFGNLTLSAPSPALRDHCCAILTDPDGFGMDGRVGLPPGERLFGRLEAGSNASLGFAFLRPPTASLQMSDGSKIGLDRFLCHRRHLVLKRVGGELDIALAENAHVPVLLLDKDASSTLATLSRRGVLHSRLSPGQFFCVGPFLVRFG